MAATTASRKRSQTAVRAKKRMTLWLEPQTDASLRAAAAAAHLSTSVLAERFIRQGLGELAAERLEGPALPAVQQIVERVMGQHTERLAGLLVKGFMEAGLGRRLSWALVHRAYGPEKAGELFDAARTRVLEDLRKKSGVQTTAAGEE